MWEPGGFSTVSPPVKTPNVPSAGIKGHHKSHHFLLQMQDAVL